MNTVLMLAFRSLYNRRTTAIMTMISIAVSVALLLGVEKLRTEAKASFSSTIAGTDLIVVPVWISTAVALFCLQNRQCDEQH